MLAYSKHFCVFLADLLFYRHLLLSLWGLICRAAQIFAALL